jgi:cysteine desulfurase/selenocysteine lyase
MSLQPANKSAISLTRVAIPVAFDAERVRQDFPILRQKVHGKPLVYLDNAATTQKPKAVIEAIRRYYERDNANIHRAVHELSQRATREYESARGKVQRFLNAASAREIIFVRGTTEGINLVTQTFGRQNVRAGDEIIVSHMEHHSNIVPWQMLCEEKGAQLRVVPINDRGEFLFEEYEKLLSARTRLVAVVHVSNSLGTVNPVRRIAEAAHRRGVPVLVDGAQAVAHLKLDVQELDCDFYAFSGHKLYGPTGIGILYGREELLKAMPPYQGGGDMISAVTFEKTTYAELPNKFEAGTPDIAGAVGLGAALDYVEKLGRDSIAAHEERLLHLALDKLRQVPGVRVFGPVSARAAVISFVIEEPPLSALDVGTRLDLEGVAVRTGHHCCQPVMDRFGVAGTVRASIAFYNTVEDVDRFVAAVQKVVREAAAHARPVQPVPYEVKYAPAVAGSPQEAAEELADLFSFFDDWGERYEQIIELGHKIPPMPDALKMEANRVHGCQSTVFISARKRPGTEDVLEFVADSDADLVRGLIAILEKVYSGQHAAEILSFDVEGFFARLGLDQHLTLGRRNGLAAMVQRIRKLAKELAAPQPAAL